MSADLITLIPIFFIIALLYSSAGFGGGSSYLAVLALFPIAFEEVRMIALLCNIAVVIWICMGILQSGSYEVQRNTVIDISKCSTRIFWRTNEDL